MIDANDLMLGNYVLNGKILFRIDYFEKNVIGMVNSEVKSDSKKWNLDSRLKLEFAEPIPISEDWLTKLGFEKQVMSYSKNIDFFGGGRRLSFSGDYLYIIDSEKQNTIPTDIVVLWNKDVMKEFSIHKLQNIYYLLTGEKLTIKQ